MSFKSLGSFQVPDLVHVFWKRYYKVYVFFEVHAWHRKSGQGTQKFVHKDFDYYSPELLSIEWAGFRDTNTYVLTESRNSKTFLRKIDTIPLDSASFIYSKKCWSWNWKECWWCLCSLHTLDINTMQIKHKINLTVCKFIKYFKLFLYLFIYKLSIYSLHKTYWLQNTET